MAGIVGRIATGMVAGLVGTLAMDLTWYARYRRRGGEDGFVEWDFTSSTATFEDTSTPGQVGRKAADALGVEIPDEAAGITTNVVHWLTGVAYGAGHAMLHHGHGALVGGLATGATAFANSYATLGALGFYQPIWEYDSDTLVRDLTAHLAFGAATGLAYRLLTGGGDDG